MLLLVCVFAVVSALFFYVQASMGGMARKRWAAAGLVFGPLIWPMFRMQKRMKIYRLLGMEELVLKA